VTDPDPPRIEFPCRYPIKVMGANDDDFVALVVDVHRRHAPGVTEEDVSVRASRGGRWVAVTVVIDAEHAGQIEAIFTDLKATGRVQLVL
jgi:putative lipoic acid-binding regulatory protein